MAKTEQQKLARTMFVEHGKNRKQIAEALGVQDKTVGNWAAAGNWEGLRTEWLTRQENVINNLKKLISSITEKLQDLDVKEAQGEAVDPKARGKLFDELSKASKTLQTVRGEGEVTLSARVRVMEWVFGEMQRQHPEIHHKLVDFQEGLLDQAARLHA